MTRNKLYFLVLMLVLAGFVWLIGNYLIEEKYKLIETTCIIKLTTGLPCPSCGSTRATKELLEGNFFKSILINPFGIIVFFASILFPLWIIYDLIRKQNSFFKFYKKFEEFIRNKNVAIFLIILVLLNWFWNIKKDL